MPAKQQTEVTTFTARDDDWWTPQWLADACREALGGHIELDPCSCARANEIIRAERYYTKEQNGLAQPWIAHTLFCNPPSRRFKKGDPEIVRTMQPRLWTEKLIGHYVLGHVGAACLVVKANHGYNWFNVLFEDFWTCFLRDRPFFLLGGVKGDAAKKGVAVVYFGKDWPSFYHVFHKRGRAIPPEAWIDRKLLDLEPDL